MGAFYELFLAVVTSVVPLSIAYLLATKYSSLFHPSIRAWWLVFVPSFLILFIVNYPFSNAFVGNFFLHAVGGGVSSAVIFLFFLLQLRHSISFAVRVIGMYFFVSGLGVWNELIEMWLWANFDVPFMAHYYDAWVDLLANTTGGMIAWMIIELIVFKHFIPLKDTKK